MKRKYLVPLILLALLASAFTWSSQTERVMEALFNVAKLAVDKVSGIVTAMAWQGRCDRTLGNCGAEVPENAVDLAPASAAGRMRFGPTSDGAFRTRRFGEGSKILAGSAGTPAGILQIINGGTGANSKAGAFDALSPLTTKGQIICFTGSTAVPIGPCPDGQLFIADGTQPCGIRCGQVNLTNAPLILGVRGSDTGDASTTTETDLSSWTVATPTTNRVYRFTSGGKIKKGGTDTVAYAVRMGSKQVCVRDLIAPTTSYTGYECAFTVTVRVPGANATTECTGNCAVGGVGGTTNSYEGNTTAVDLSAANVTVKTTAKWAAGTGGDSMIETNLIPLQIDGGSVSGSSPGVACTDLSPSFLAAWPLDANGNVDLTTTGGSGYNLTLNGSPTFNTTVGQFIQGSGSMNSSIAANNFGSCTAANCPGLGAAAGNMSCYSFFRPTALGTVNHYIFRKTHEASPLDGFILRIAADSTMTATVMNTSKSTTNLAQLNIMNIAAFSFDNGAHTVFAYLNGVATTNQTGVATLTGSDDFKLGADNAFTNPSGTTDGQIDDSGCAAKVVSSSYWCYVSSCGRDGKACRGDSTNPANFKLCTQDSDCGPVGSKCDTTSSLCTGYNHALAGGCTIPACNVAQIP